MTNVRGSPLRVNRETIISDVELDQAIARARTTNNIYFKLRAVAVISLARLSGKRRGELAQIPRPYFKVIGNYLEVTFILEKKRKKSKVLVTKKFSLRDTLTQNIVEYLNFLDQQYPGAEYWLPSGKVVFGENYKVNLKKHLSPRHVFNLIRDNSESIWPHLNRETVAADIISKDDSVNAIFKVQQTLDLDPKRGFETALHYVQRYSKQVINRQAQA